ncbi:MAG: DUF434 domain-containing protein [Bacillota bacterium]|nr:DUF434 domain-containing protein [Bacillota bacterium]
MSPAATRRGFDIEDHKRFSETSVEKLRIAQQEIQWLLDRGYKEGPLVDFVGGHYQLSLRQRNALKRATCTKIQYEKRKSTMLSIEDAKDGCLIIDGFNLIISLEVALSRSVIILGTDGVLRDLAGLRGSYKIIEQTDRALEILGKSLNRLSVPEVRILLDAPVSNSGQLRNRILEHALDWRIPVDVELVPNADVVLSNVERIVTGDSVLLDQCNSWINLCREIVENYIENAWIIKLCAID